MNSENFDISGEGEHEFTTWFDPYKVIIWLTEPGMSRSMDLVAPARFLDIGWIALYEHYVSDVLVPDGYYLTEPHFIYSDNSYMHVGNDWSGSGVDGLRWYLRTGVEAHVKVVFIS